MSDKIIQITEMNKWFGDFQVLKNINLEVEKNKKIVVCGPSGSGKSTLIRCINRLEEHQQGSIIVDGNELTEDTKDIEKIRAEVGMVFHQFNLLTLYHQHPLHTKIEKSYNRSLFEYHHSFYQIIVETAPVHPFQYIFLRALNIPPLIYFYVYDLSFLIFQIHIQNTQCLLHIFPQRFLL